MMTDPIADMLTRIRNAATARKRTVVIPLSNLKKAIAEILREEGYVEHVVVKDENPRQLILTLGYIGKDPKIQFLKRESTPGHRKYYKAEELPRVLNDYGVAILSTSKGLMTNKKARKEGIGGEILCSVY